MKYKTHIMKNINNETKIKHVSFEGMFSSKEKAYKTCFI